METWINQKVAQLSALVEAEDAEPWVRQCALISGLPLADIQFVAESLNSAPAGIGTIESWSAWILNLLETRSAMTEAMLRAGSRAALTGAPEELDDWVTSGSMLVQHLRVLLPPWLRGESLLKIQQVGITRKLAKNADKKLTFARKFMLRVVPDLAYLFSLPGMVIEQRAALGSADPLPADHPLRVLGRCVELGVDSAEKIERLEASPSLSRRDVRSRS
ncbi:hypothetical protein [Pseudoclavibacter sp. 13-3]|uniref:hypothetical protein n=1 Tax=Pseudoclavibacter sp. 13-3 TaxID=2901228 RepID=UPI001E5D8FA0|nr:hypothetical protein [Pseudoclavibacter sp. 13-3]MCD7100720.1 hypothetical protein [Pseudoclavibacter sp. 13-3]